MRTLVLDAGHGGKDPGTLGPNSREKDIVLPVTLKVGAYVERAFPDVRVVYTRTTDTFIELNRRTEIANEAQADLFISIHCNSAPTHAAYGTETFVMGLDKTNNPANLAVAQRENAVISFEEDYSEKYEGYDPNSPESFIIFSLMRNIFLNQSLNLAGLIQDEFTTRVKRHDRGVKQERFLVLYKSAMPSVLIELGFLSNKKEEQFLLSEHGQDLMASAIFRAFRRYKEKVEQRTSSLVIADPPSLARTEGVRYRVQVSSVKKPIARDHRLYKDFPGLIEEKRGAAYRYYAGERGSMAEAQRLLDSVRVKYKDAFIVRVDP